MTVPCLGSKTEIGSLPITLGPRLDMLPVRQVRPPDEMEPAPAIAMGGSVTILRRRTHHVPQQASSAGEGGAGETLAGVGEDEQGTGQRLAGELAGVQAGGGGGDVEVAEARPAEGAGGGTGRWHLDPAVELARGGESLDDATVPERHPDTAVGVDRQPVRKARHLGKLKERAPAGDQTGARVDVEQVDAAGGAVHVVHATA